MLPRQHLDAVLIQEGEIRDLHKLWHMMSVKTSTFGSVHDMKTMLIRCLIFIYPTTWRRDNGETLFRLLADSSLSHKTIRNVITKGLQQRFRSAELWVLVGIFDALWLIIGTIINSFSPMSSGGMTRFFSVDWALTATVGFLYVAHYSQDSLSAAIVSAKAATLGMLPEMMLGILWAIGLVHPTILSTHGTPYVRGSQITDLFIRMDGPPSPSYLLLVIPLSVISAFISGYIGALAAKFFTSQGNHPHSA